MKSKIGVFRYYEDGFNTEKEFVGFYVIEHKTEEELEKEFSKIADNVFDCQCDFQDNEEDDGLEQECTCHIVYDKVSLDTTHYDEEEEQYFTASEFLEKEIAERQNYIQILENRNQKFLKDISESRKKILDNNEKIQSLKNKIVELTKER